MSRTHSRSTSRIQDRLIDELIGICRGVIADDEVDEKEAIFIGQWIEQHGDVEDRWPVNVLYARLTEMLKDGVLNLSEQQELLETLREITGDRADYQTVAKSTSLPLDRPPPEVNFNGSTFCLTGRFVFGSNLDCEDAIMELGGEVAANPTSETDYLVIGEMSSPDWVHTAFGRGIEKAVAIRDGGSTLAIVSEEHWVNAMGLVSQ